MQEHKNSYTDLETAIGKLRMLSGESQIAITSIISRLAKAEGVSITSGHRLPIENLKSWIIKLKVERKSERTIRLYGYLVRRFLKQIPKPTRADIREYLARRIGQTSPSSAETERKALATIAPFSSSMGIGGVGKGGVSLSRTSDSQRGAPPNREVRERWVARRMALPGGQVSPVSRRGACGI